jgi:hypothetical protein
VKSLKRIDLNLNLKGYFEKGLKKKKKKKKKETHLAYLSAQQPAYHLPMAAHGRRLFFFSSCLTDIPAPLVSGAPFTFLSSSPSSTSSGPAPP